jgi:hypothetical protein
MRQSRPRECARERQVPGVFLTLNGVFQVICLDDQFDHEAVVRRNSLYVVEVL